MKMLKYFLVALILFINVNYVCAYTFDNTLKVYDYAQDLTEREQENLKKEVKEYISKNNIDMVIVVVRNHTYDSLEEYTNEFYIRNGFGIDSDKSGIILVLDVKEKKSNIKTYGKAKDLYNSIEINSMISLINNSKKTYSKARNFIKSSNSYMDYDMKEIGLSKYKNVSILLPLIISIISSLSIISIILLKLKKNKKRINVVNPYIIENYILNKNDEIFVTTSTKQIN